MLLLTSWCPTEYTIRMNFTTVPSSRQEVNRYSHGVPRGYKRYYTSGFMVRGPAGPCSTP